MHDTYTHAEDGRICIWASCGWFVPLDVGGEGDPCDRKHHMEGRTDLETEQLLCDAIEILEYALRLRMYGEEPLTGTWRAWESSCETFVRRFGPEPREKYMPHNETPTIQGVKMSEQNTTDLTEATPTLEPSTRKKIKKGTTIALGAVAVLLLVDDQVKRFKQRKSVKLTVVDKPDTDTEK